MKLIKGYKITKRDIIIAGILFVAVVALPAHFSMANWQELAMYTIAVMMVIGLGKLSYLRGKNEKTAS